MKKVTAFLIALLLVIISSGCNKGEKTANDEKTKPSETVITDTDSVLVRINCFSDTGLAVGGLNSDTLSVSAVQHLPIYKIENKSELESFTERYKTEITSIDEYSGNESFSEAVAFADDLFFEKNSVLIVYISSSSGSYRFGVNSIVKADNELLVHIEQTNDPEVFTCDMASYLAVITVEKSLANGVLRFDADLIN